MYHLARGLLGLSRAGVGLLGLTMALAALLISAGLQVWPGAPAAYERLHAHTEAPHAWFVLPNHPAGAAAAAAISADPAVDRETFRLPVAALPLVAGGEGAARTVDVRVYALEDAAGPNSAGSANATGRADAAGRAAVAGPAGFALTAGRWPTAGQAEAVIDRHLAAALGLSVGDAVHLAGHDGPAGVRIVGEAASALHCPYPECVLPPVLVPADLFTRLVRQPNMLLGVRLKAPDTAAAFAFAARRRAADVGLALEAGNWLDVLAHQRLSHSLTAGFLVLAGAFSLAAGAAVTSHVVAAAAIAGRRVMGLARALGCTPRQVVGALALGCTAVGLAAAAVGAPVGATVAWSWVAGDLAALAAGNTAGTGAAVAGAGTWAAAAGALAVTVATAGLGAWAARGAAWAGTAATMAAAGGGVPVRLRLGLPGLPQLVVILPVRPAVPAAAVAISVAVAVGAATLANTMAVFAQDPARVGVFHQLVVERAGLPAADAEALVRANPEVDGFHREAWVRVDVPQGATSILVRALDGDWRALPWRVLEGSFVAAPGEIALGTSAMERLGVRPGDVVEVAVGPLRARWRVTGTYLDLTNAGFTGAVVWETLADVYPRLEPAAWLVRLTPGADAEAVRQRLLHASGGRLVVTRAGFDPPAAVRTARRLVDGLALLLGGLAVVAVVQSMTATVREQRRD
ncbi:MAG TPA: ABC transporter permease, partial [Limnochordales bacterium]